MHAVDKKYLPRRSMDENPRFSTLVGENVRFNGSFSGSENIVVRGHVNGESDISALVVIAESGSWEGALSADRVVVAGRVKGDIVAREKIELLATARVEGKISCPFIAIATGAVHDGQMDMGSAVRIERFFEKRKDPANFVSEHS